MSKLLKLRESLPIEAAAGYLSQVLEDRVTVAELYALAHEGAISLSVGFKEIQWAQPISIFDSEEEALEAGFKTVNRVHIRRLGRYAYAGNEDTVEGLLDLAMVGGEREMVRDLAFGKTDFVDSIYFDELIFADANKRFWRPVTLSYENGGYAPKATGWYFPQPDFALCVRVRELNRVIESVAESLVQQASGQLSDGLDPSDLPEELQAANIAFRAVSNGFGNPEATFKSRLVAYLETSSFDLGQEAIKRIATVANPAKEPGRRRRGQE